MLSYNYIYRSSSFYLITSNLILNKLALLQQRSTAQKLLNPRIAYDTLLVVDLKFFKIQCILIIQINRNECPN